MPGPVSDSYDPEFGTGSNRSLIRDSLGEIVEKIGKAVGTRLAKVVDVARSENGASVKLQFSERELRLIRFSLNRTLEDLD